MLRNVLLVGAGGFLGASARYLVGIAALRLPLGLSYPWGTLIVNVAGCLAIGAAGGWAEARGTLLDPDFRHFFVVGVLGGLTTFSAFAYETHLLSRTGGPSSGATNVLLHLALGLLAVWAGWWAVLALRGR